MKKPKTNFFKKPVECWNCCELKHKIVLTKHHGVLCKQCYGELYEDYLHHFNFFMSSLEMDGFNPDDYNIQTLESLTEVMHDYYKTYIIDSKRNDIRGRYKTNVKFVNHIYLSLEKERTRGKK